MPNYLKPLIILKGFPSSGKSTCLKSHLPILFDYSDGKRSIFYNDLWILIIRRSIHESPDWQNVAKKVIECEYDIIIIAAWADECIYKSENVKKKLEDILEEKSPNKFKYHIVHTNNRENVSEQANDQERCAIEIKNIVDAYINRREP